ncbi:MAG TPA: 8-oxo-dGTP diphosphatase MutT [Vicinamibacteria bacterium]|jgi:8-oxo-dGTP diphosphatase
MSESPAPTIVVAAGVVSLNGKILAARRQAGAHLAGLWEFPGGKLQMGESPEECLVREFAEELGVRIQAGRILEVIHHRYPDRTVLLLFYACELLEGKPRPLGCEEIRWLDRQELETLEWAPADLPFVKRLATGRPAPRS